MLTADSYLYRSEKSLLILFRIWVYNNLKAFADRLEHSLVNDFTSGCEILEKDFVRITNLSSQEAAKELKSFKKLVSFIERLDRSMINTKSRKMQIAFKPFKKMVYKTEARLHKIAYQEHESLITDEVLKQQISDFGRKSILSTYN
ncbi:hypothetical protein [Mucilaginibacter flavidus]|uniref:hypothetical protein n=1 Tax=Mucilaginibacter flavidus TaxID=2949309 RepID=UPI00209336D3|nr:hypothetical protein [Mucilaginibacter flavidus]MCO5945709.1 hypothetical protein [Mucilaginibacter flavidus]